MYHIILLNPDRNIEIQYSYIIWGILANFETTTDYIQSLCVIGRVTRYYNHKHYVLLGGYSLECSIKCKTLSVYTKFTVFVFLPISASNQFQVNFNFNWGWVGFISSLSSNIPSQPPAGNVSKLEKSKKGLIQYHLRNTSGLLVKILILSYSFHNMQNT